VPTDDELHALLQTVITRLMKMLTRRGVLVEDMGRTYLAEPDADGEEARTLRPHVEDCDTTASKAQRLGARSLVAATDIPEIGRFAALADPFGAPFAVIRSLGVRLSDEEAASDADPGGAL